MKLALRNLQRAAHLDRTTPAFTAHLIVNGIHRGTVRNDGSGGANYYTDRDVEREINAYAATLPLVELEGQKFPETAETLIFGLVYDAQKVTTEPLIEIKIGRLAKWEATSLQHASQLWQNYRDEHGFGSRDAPKVLLYQGGKKIGTISYNGRLWDLHGIEIPLEGVKTPSAKRPFHPETNPRFVWNIGAIAEEYPDMPEQDDENNAVLIDRADGTPVLTLHNPWAQAICLETTDTPHGAPFEALAHWFNHLSPEALESENLPVAPRQ